MNRWQKCQRIFLFRNYFHKYIKIKNFEKTRSVFMSIKSSSSPWVSLSQFFCNHSPYCFNSPVAQRDSREKRTGLKEHIYEILICLALLHWISSQRKLQCRLYVSSVLKITKVFIYEKRRKMMEETHGKRQLPFWVVLPLASKKWKGVSVDAVKYSIGCKGNNKSHSYRVHLR